MATSNPNPSARKTGWTAVAIPSIALWSALVLPEIVLDYSIPALVNIGFISLLALEFLSFTLFILAQLFFSKQHNQIRSASRYLLLVIVVIAAIRAVEWALSGLTCSHQNFHRFEFYCEGLFMQSFFNLPFVGLGLIFLWINRPNR